VKKGKKKNQKGKEGDFRAARKKEPDDSSSKKKREEREKKWRIQANGAGEKATTGEEGGGAGVGVCRKWT